MESVRKLPIGIQSFEDLRTNGYLYVDKTAYIWSLVNRGKAYFLSRPRRFGKSLLISTLEAYFQGRKDLFRGLSIEKQENARLDASWQEYPIIHFSFADGDFQTEQGLKDKLNDVIENTAMRYNLTDLIRGETLPVRFGNLIVQLHQQKQHKVVVLVDEYDKPLLDTMEINKDQEEKNRLFYKSFFGALKSQDEHLKFVFFTGVTKFSKVSIFSDLNQLRDISLDDDYACICGITEEELETIFSPEISRMSETNRQTRNECLHRLADMYDGYHFSRNSQGIYNPFSILNAFDKKDFGSYWFSTGTPTFLINKLRRTGFRAEQFVDGVQATELSLLDYQEDNPDPIPLFYQSGYLTIRGWDARFRVYDLSFPNAEVKYGFMNSLADMMIPQDENRPGIS